MNTILVEHVRQSIDNAERQISKLRPEWKLLELHGLNSDRNRMLLNNLVDMPGAVYLELGTYRGASLLSALFKNDHALVYAVDNFCFSAFEGHPITTRKHPSDDIAWPNVKLAFYDNLFKQYGRDRVKFIESDFLKVKLYDFKKPINIIHLDTISSTSSQDILGILNHYYPSFAETFILVVNSYSQPEIRIGVDLWNNQKKHKILYQEEKKSQGLCDSDNWWAGLNILVIEKVNL